MHYSNTSLIQRTACSKRHRRIMKLILCASTAATLLLYSKLGHSNLAEIWQGSCYTPLCPGHAAQPWKSSWQLSVQSLFTSHCTSWTSPGVKWVVEVERVHPHTVSLANSWVSSLKMTFSLQLFTFHRHLWNRYRKMLDKRTGSRGFSL